MSRGPYINAPTELADFSLNKIGPATLQMVLPSLLVLLFRGRSGSIPSLRALTEHRPQLTNMIDIACAGSEHEG
jgi:hypothetical protein